MVAAMCAVLVGSIGATRLVCFGKIGVVFIAVIVPLHLVRAWSIATSCELGGAVATQKELVQFSYCQQLEQYAIFYHVCDAVVHLREDIRMIIHPNSQARPPLVKGWSWDFSARPCHRVDQ